MKVFHYETLDSLSAHVLTFVTAYTCAKHLKALRWRTPFQAICDAWIKDPAPCKIGPPPSKWSDLKYGLGTLQEDRDGEQTTYA